MRGFVGGPVDKDLTFAREINPPRIGRILVVDDEPEHVGALGEFLDKKGYEVAGAFSGEEALKIMEPNGFDLAFVDIRMPGMSGIELVSRIRHGSPNLPVVIMTAYSTVECAVEAFRTGATDFLAKPLRLKDIELMLERLVRRSAVSPGLESLIMVLASHENGLGDELAGTLRQIKDLASLWDSSHSSGDSSALYQHLARVASEMVSSGLALVSVLDSDSATWTVKAAEGFERLNLGGAKAVPGGTRDFAPSIPPVARAIIDDQFSHVVKFNQPISTTDISTIPLRIKSRVFGALHLFHFERQRPMSALEMSPFEAVANEVSLHLENTLLYEKIYENLVKTFRTMVEMMESKDPYIKDHSKGVCQLACSIASEMGCSPEEVDMLNFACYFHDVGKVAIRDHILMRTGPLSDEDFETMKSHTIVGEKLLEPLELLEIEKTVIRHHHERLDGSGYPDGLRGEEISLFARIVAVADVFDAMVSTRCYRPAYPPHQVLEYLHSEAGRKFDAHAVKALASVVQNRPHNASHQGLLRPS